MISQNPWLFVLFMGLMPICSKAQRLTDYTLYDQISVYYNPADVDTSKIDALITGKFYPNQTSLTGKSSAMFVHVGREFDELKGRFQLNFSREAHSYYNQNRFSLGYTYPVRLKGHNFAFGARISGQLTAVNHSNWFVSPQTTTSVSFQPDLDVGFVYGFRGLKVGIGVLQLFSPEIRENGVVAAENLLATNYSLSYHFQLKNDQFLRVGTLLGHQRFWRNRLNINYGVKNKLDVGVVVKMRKIQLSTLSVGGTVGYFFNGEYGVFASYNRNILFGNQHWELLFRTRLFNSKF